LRTEIENDWVVTIKTTATTTVMTMMIIIITIIIIINTHAGFTYRPKLCKLHVVELGVAAL
jgi:hypothetical protein